MSLENCLLVLCMNIINMSAADVSRLANESYICLETYRKNEKPVKTPVWFIVDHESIYVVTKENTGKVKRLKYNGDVRIATCNFRGKITGDWIHGQARLVSSDEQEEVIKKRNKKYGFKATLANLFTRGKGNYAVIEVKI
jgi:PPOX class probable F420-dependent enzyme